MKLFYYKKVLGRIWLEILGIKMLFVIPARKKNYYISLGTNCFSRRILTDYGIKPKKKQGELSCPFDLCITPLESIITLLEMDFNGFLDTLVYNDDCKEWKMWINTQYDIKFAHDGDLSLEKFKTRYSDRIKNFKYICEHSNFVKFIITLYNNNFSYENLNRLYDSLYKFRKGKDFKLIVFSVIDDNSPILSLSELNPKIIFKELKTTSVDEFYANWNRPHYLNNDILTNIAKTVDK